MTVETRDIYEDKNDQESICQVPEEQESTQ